MDDMPRLGLGTYDNTDREQCIESVKTAIEMGYRHVDTAQMYDNEEYVGEGIEQGLEAAGIDRDELFVATKLDTDNTGYDDVVETTKESLDRLGLDYVDLMYVHWPTNAYDPEETLPALDEVVDEGLVDHVGLSNFRPDQLDEAREILDTDLFAHQVEMHPMLPQRELVSYAQEHDHYLVAYCPIARGDVADSDRIQEIAERHDASPYQVSLAWLLSKDNVAAIPKATGEEHIRDNFGALDLTLSEDDLATIDNIGERERIVDPDDAPWNQA